MKVLEIRKLENYYESNADSIKSIIKLYNINNVPAFLGQVAHESDCFTKNVESFNYSSDRLLKTFKRSRISEYYANAFGRHERIVNGRRVIVKKADQVNLANILYGGSFGLTQLGNIQSGDGWKYRGRTFMMCTGRWNYGKYGKFKGLDFINNPDLLLDDSFSLDFAGYYWATNEMNKCNDDNVLITKVINGGIIGIDDRVEKTLFFKQLIKSNGFK